jgi:uncharacterized protein (DUF849 family)
MTKPCIICVAITGSLPRKENNSAVPISVTEQIESTQEAFEAGASIVHTHVRNDDETPSSDPERVAASNAALVRRAVELFDKHERPVATWAHAREILGLRQNGRGWMLLG